MPHRQLGFIVETTISWNQLMNAAISANTAPILRAKWTICCECSTLLWRLNSLFGMINTFLNDQLFFVNDQHFSEWSTLFWNINYFLKYQLFLNDQLFYLNWSTHFRMFNSLFWMIITFLMRSWSFDWKWSCSLTSY